MTANHCQLCNTPRNILVEGACLPCIAECAGVPHIGFALAMRDAKRPRFSLKSLNLFCESLTPEEHQAYYYSGSVLNDSIIKYCEQLKFLVLSNASGTRYLKEQPVNIPRMGSDRTGLHRCAAYREQIKDSLLTRYHHLCFYCGTPLDRETAHIDSILPTHLDHSEGNPLGYYRTLMEVGCAVPTCYGCERAKSGPEHAGITRFQYWRRGKYRATAVPSLRPCRPRRCYEYVPGQREKHDTRNGQLPMHEAAGSVMRAMMLRVRLGCICNDGVQPTADAHYVISLAPNNCELLITCPVCVPDGTPLVRFTRPSYRWWELKKNC